ncbi:MAG TPA: prepilin-type N-terminal cleavage/methylation domain-containing protein [Conexibacter sp.]|jgi:type IV pilus assembly protein PilA|nr:prepilin-type N-terminal cleavage/methylation domain-containing protein [Conexibacter sp.]
MLHTIRRRMNDERGFTLIELLVVILIIGILAAIAIPSFLSQKDKAGDASAKSFARNMQTAQETYFTDNNAYADSLARLQAIEQALNEVPNRASLPTATNTPASGFTVTATSPKGVTYTISRDATGQITRTCDRTNVGGCNSGGSW